MGKANSDLEISQIFGGEDVNDLPRRKEHSRVFRHAFSYIHKMDDCENS